MPSTDTPIPAATVVILRERPGGAPELLMVERAAAIAFAAGAMVFPGGRVDPGDHALAAELALDPEDGPARVAAVRECIEEARAAPGVTPGDASTKPPHQNARDRLIFSSFHAAVSSKIFRRWLFLHL